MKPHWLDRLVAAALPAGAWFREGWGDERVLEETSVEPAAALPAPPLIEIAWEREERFAGIRVRDGPFESPEARLPAPVRRARVRLVEPAGAASAACLHLASSGEEGYSRRARFARPLVGAEDDGFVSPEGARRIAAHWEGAELRWLGGGHASAFLLGAAEMRRAVADAFERL